MSLAKSALVLCISIFSFLALPGCLTPPVRNVEAAQNHLEIAQGLMRGSNYPDAMKELLIALDYDSTNPDIHYNLGIVYGVRERLELAEKHYLKALSYNPKHTDARNGLARIYIEMGKYKSAEAQLKISLDDLTYAQYNMTYALFGLLEFKRGNFAKAVPHFKKSLEKDRENCPVQVMLGRSYLESGDPESASAQLERAIPFCTQIESDEAHYYSAIALYRSNKTETARLKFEELVSTYPSGPNAEKARKMIEIIKKAER